jgi:hypothetical protein
METIAVVFVSIIVIGTLVYSGYQFTHIETK